jgi:hypothetical protein
MLSEIRSVPSVSHVSLSCPKLLAGVSNYAVIQEAQTQNLAFYLTQDQASAVNNGRRVETNGMVVYKNHILLR